MKHSPLGHNSIKIYVPYRLISVPFLRPTIYSHSRCPNGIYHISVAAALAAENCSTGLVDIHSFWRRSATQKLIAAATKNFSLILHRI